MFDAVFAGIQNQFVFIYNFGNQSKIKSPPMLLSLIFSRCNSNSPHEGSIGPHHRSPALGVEAMFILHALHHFTYRRSKKSVTKNGKESPEHKVCEIEITQEKNKTKH